MDMHILFFQPLASTDGTSAYYISYIPACMLLAGTTSVSRHVEFFGCLHALSFVQHKNHH